MTNTQTLKQTPLYNAMLALGGKMVNFHGWQLPVQFKGIMDEHKAVRSACGIFDVSHMGQVFVNGKDAYKFVSYINSNNIKNVVGAGVYSHVLNEKGGIVDDVIAFCLSQERFLVIVNSATTEKDFAWFQKNSKGFDVKLENKSENYGMFALQGPKSLDVMKEICLKALELPRFGILETSILGEDVFVSRTGYTGEDGFEVIADKSVIEKIWNAFVKNPNHTVTPCGLGARDTLRLEAGYLLYGQDANDDTTSYQAGYGWVVKMKKENFIGKAALLEKGKIHKTQLKGIKLLERGVPRPDLKVIKDGQEIGHLTSATFSPTFSCGIAMGYVPTELKEGDEVFVRIHNKDVKAQICKTPFYQNKV
jgi:glycine cleavage system T protein (aminomethyltransferase)